MHKHLNIHVQCSPWDEKSRLHLSHKLYESEVCWVFSGEAELLPAVCFLLYCRLDYCGIALLTMGSFVPWLYYSFYCRTEPKITYLVLIFVLGTACIIVSMWDKFAEPKFRPVRAGKFPLTVGEDFTKHLWIQNIQDTYGIFGCNLSFPDLSSNHKWVHLIEGNNFWSSGTIMLP